MQTLNDQGEDMNASNAVMNRCRWCGEDPLYVRYHDDEWGVPQKDINRLFEFLLLEGAQAGLSWITILRKREGYRDIFDGFSAEKLAVWSDERLETALQSPRIVRNRLKVWSVRQNARAVVALRESGTAFSDYLWDFVDHATIANHWKSDSDVPPQTPLSIRISKDMKQRGFTFVGPTIIYAFMQAVGMVNDHVVSCFRHRECISSTTHAAPLKGKVDTAKKNT